LNGNPASQKEEKVKMLTERINELVQKVSNKRYYNSIVLLKAKSCMSKIEGEKLKTLEISINRFIIKKMYQYSQSGTACFVQNLTLSNSSPSYFYVI
jgi:hypothetical protein